MGVNLQTTPCRSVLLEYFSMAEYMQAVCMHVDFGIHGWNLPLHLYLGESNMHVKEKTIVKSTLFYDTYHSHSQQGGKHIRQGMYCIRLSPIHIFVWGRYIKISANDYTRTTHSTLCIIYNDHRSNQSRSAASWLYPQMPSIARDRSKESQRNQTKQMGSGKKSTVWQSRHYAVRYDQHW